MWSVSGSMEEVGAAPFEAKLLFSLFVISSDTKDDVFVCFVHGWFRLHGDDLVDVFV